MAHPHQPPVPTGVLDGAIADYPSDRRYFIVAAILAAFTAAETSTYWLRDYAPLDDGRILVATLLLLMGLKFWSVAAYFMHLRFDKRVLTILFYGGISLAVLLYMAVLTAFRFWWPAASAIAH